MHIPSWTRIALLATAALMVVAGCGEREAPSPPAETVAAPTPEPVPAPAGRKAPTPPKVAATGPFSAPGLLDRVAILGASASFGLGATLPAAAGNPAPYVPVDLVAIWSAGLASSAESRALAPTKHADMFFFAAPMHHGPRLVEEALAEDPTLVVAVDFLFWFGYGSLGQPMPDTAARLALLDEGLTLLDRFRVPIVVGDFADMSPAIGGMLSASQVPSPEALAALNTRLRDWAARQPNVRVLPLADFTTKIQGGREVVIGAHRWSPTGAPLLQPDALHPSADGLIALSQLVAAALEASPGVQAGTVDFDRNRVLARLAASE